MRAGRYGFEAPYDASGDYFAAEELRARALARPDLERFGAYAHVWGNASEDCYSNCTAHCADACFGGVHGRGACDEEREAAAAMRAELGLPAAHPRQVAEAHNNCTLRICAPRLEACQGSCTARCANLTDVMPTSVVEEAELAALYDSYVVGCERKCRLQIYGRNVTREEQCLVFTPTYRQDCLNNCTDDARAFCANPNMTVDVTVHCNATCLYLYVDVDVGVEVVGNGTDGGTDAADELAFNLPPPPPLTNEPYERCMEHCEGNFTLDPSYLCDSGLSRRDALAAADAYGTRAPAALPRSQRGPDPSATPPSVHTPHSAADAPARQVLHRGDGLAGHAGHHAARAARDRPAARGRAPRRDLHLRRSGLRVQ